MLNFKNKAPYVEGVALEDIAKIQKTPYYIYSQAKISDSYNKLNEILSNAHLIELKNCQRGKYFRLVCDVLADGLSVSDILVTEGVAVIYE